VIPCEECRKAVTPAMIGACASVGIEHQMSTEGMLRLFLRSYHERGHVDEP